MALRKEKPEAIALYKKLTMIFAGVTMVLSTLLSITSVWMLAFALLLALFPKFLWKHSAVKVITRTVEIVLLAAVPLLIIGVAVAGKHQTEYFSLLIVMQAVLPAAAIAALAGERFDIVFLRVSGAAHFVSSALICAYILPVQQWVRLALFGAGALVMLFLPFMAYPLQLTKKTSEKQLESK